MLRKSIKNQWIIFILFSALTRGIGDIFYKKLSFDFSPQTILLFSSFLNILFLVPTFGCIEVLEPKLMGFVFLKAVAMTTAWLLFLYSLKKLPISVATPLQILSTLFAIIFGFIFLKEYLTILQSLGIFILLGGLLTLQIISKKESSQKTSSFLSMAFFSGVLASFFSAFYIFIFVNTFLVFLVLKTPYKKALQNLKTKWWIFVILSLFLVISDRTYMIAATYPLALLGLLIPMKRLSIIFSVFIGGKAFKERNLNSNAYWISINGLVGDGDSSTSLSRC